MNSFGEWESPFSAGENVRESVAGEDFVFWAVALFGRRVQGAVTQE